MCVGVTAELGRSGYQIARCWRQLTPSGTPLRRRASSPRGGAQVTAELGLSDLRELTESRSPSIRAPSARHHTSSLFPIPSYFEKEPPGCRSVIFRCRAPQNNASHASHGRAVTCNVSCETNRPRGFGMGRMVRGGQDVGKEVDGSNPGRRCCLLLREQKQIVGSAVKKETERFNIFISD